MRIVIAEDAALFRHGSGLAGLQDRERDVGGELSGVSQIERGT